MEKRRTELNKESKALALKLYEGWVYARRERPDFMIPENRKELDEARRKNFIGQLAGPRREHLKKLREIAPKLTTADTVALLVMLELPALEISTLLNRLRNQLTEDKDAVYFSPVNMADNCGSGCG